MGSNSGTGGRRRLLVTGSNGLLGQKLTQLLCNDPGVHFIATARSKSVIPVSPGEFHHLDVSSAEDVDAVIRATRPAEIIHTAAMTNVDQCELDHDGAVKSNITAVENLIRVCTEQKVRLIYISTDFVFSGSQGPLDETAQPDPVNFYGKTKAAAEKLVMESGLDWCILRTVLVYGITPDMSRSNIVLWVKNSLESGKTIHVVNDQWRTPTLAEDLAIGCALALKKNAKGIFHISGKDFLTPYELALRTASFFRLDSSLIVPTDEGRFSQPAIRPLRTGFIIEKARIELGYEPRSLEDGLAVLASQLKAYP